MGLEAERGHRNWKSPWLTGVQGAEGSIVWNEAAMLWLLMSLECFNHGNCGEVSLRKNYVVSVQFLGEYGVRKKEIREIFQILMTSSWVRYTQLHSRGCSHRDNDQIDSCVEAIIYSKCIWKLLLCVECRGNLITFVFPYDNSSYRMEFQKLGWLPFLL